MSDKKDIFTTFEADGAGILTRYPANVETLRVRLVPPVFDAVELVHGWNGDDRCIRLTPDDAEELARRLNSAAAIARGAAG